MTTSKDKKPKPAPKAKAKTPAKRALVKKPPPDFRAEARDKCVAFGVENLVDCILEGMSLGMIAKKIEVSKPTLLRWIASDETIAARSTEARTAAARHWDEMAEELVAFARDPFQLAKAQALAHHYRWRSSCTDPARFNPSRPNAAPGAGVNQADLLSELSKMLPD